MNIDVHIDTDRRYATVEWHGIQALPPACNPTTNGLSWLSIASSSLNSAYAMPILLPICIYTYIYSYVCSIYPSINNIIYVHMYKSLHQPEGSMISNGCCTPYLMARVHLRKFQHCKRDLLHFGLDVGCANTWLQIPGEVSRVCFIRWGKCKLDQHITKQIMVLFMCLIRTRAQPRGGCWEVGAHNQAVALQIWGEFR